jgi:hypothetical protein
VTVIEIERAPEPAMAVLATIPEQSATALVFYDAMCRAIGAAYEVDEVKDIRDRAAALEHYSRQAHNVEAERQCCEIRLRAERKWRQLYDAGEKAKGTRGQLSGREGSGGPLVAPPEENERALSDLGVTKRQAADWAKLAALSDQEFEAALAGPEKPTTNGIITAAFPPKPKPVSSEALWLWGRLRDFERDGLLDKGPASVLETMTPEMREVS